MERRARGQPLAPQVSLAAFYRFFPGRNWGFASEIVEELISVEGIEDCFPEIAPAVAEPVWEATPNTPAPRRFSTQALGMELAWRRLGGQGDQAALVDIEGGWLTSGVGYDLLYSRPLWGQSVFESDRRHGAKTLTTLIGRDALMGYLGLVPRLASRIRLASYVNESSSCDTTNAIVAAIDATERFPGAVILLEVTRGACHRSTPSASLPTEVFEPDYHAIRLATALGFVVVEAAGNGAGRRGVDLDSAQNLSVAAKRGRLWLGDAERLCRSSPRFRDSGAIVVGALDCGPDSDEGGGVR